jgi:hypothetical protein
MAMTRRSNRRNVRDGNLSSVSLEATRGEFSSREFNHLAFVRVFSVQLLVNQNQVNHAEEKTLVVQ